MQKFRKITYEIVVYITIMYYICNAVERDGNRERYFPCSEREEKPTDKQKI